MYDIESESTSDLERQLAEINKRLNRNLTSSLTGQVLFDPRRRSDLLDRDKIKAVLQARKELL